MSEETKINKLILETIKQSASNAKVNELLVESLHYELDIWNRRIFDEDIRDQYDTMVRKILKGSKDEI